MKGGEKSADEKYRTLYIMTKKELADLIRIEGIKANNQLKLKSFNPTEKTESKLSSEFFTKSGKVRTAPVDRDIAKMQRQLAELKRFNHAIKAQKSRAKALSQTAKKFGTRKDKLQKVFDWIKDTNLTNYENSEKIVETMLKEQADSLKDMTKSDFEKIYQEFEDYQAEHQEIISIENLFNYIKEKKNETLEEN